MHRVLAISSEDGDPYEAFSEADDDSSDGEGFDGVTGADDDTEDLDLLDPSAENPSVAYAYAPGDMVSIPAGVPVTAIFQGASDQPFSDLPAAVTAPGPTAVPALPTSLPIPGRRDQTVPSHEQQIQQSQQQARAASVVGNNGPAATPAAASDSPRLLQAIVWQPGKVLSLFPWQLRAHFFLSLASTRMYLLMGLWPRTPAVVAAAPRRLRQQQAHNGAHYHAHAPGNAPTAMQGSGASSSGGAGVDGPGLGPPAHVGAGTGIGPGTGPTYYPSHSASHYPHPHAQAQAAAAHAYAHYAHGYDGYGGLYGFGRSNQDESQSLASALSALGRGVPVFLPPEMLVKHGVQEDLMASCAFKPAAKHVSVGTPATSGGGGGGTPADGDSRLLPRWRSLPSLLGRWMARLAERIAKEGNRAAAKIRGPTASAAPPTVDVVARAAPVAAGALVAPPGASPLPTSPGVVATEAAAVHVIAEPQGGSRIPVKSEAMGMKGVAISAAATSVSAYVPQHLPPASQGAAPTGAAQSHPQQPQEPQQPQHAYVECRLYRTDRVRNISYTCPAVLTVLPSPPRSSGFGLSRLLQRFKPKSHQPPPQVPSTHPHYQATQSHAGGASGAGPLGRPQPRARLRLLRRLWHDLRYMSYGVMMPYKWAPLLAGLLSPHMFLLACLPAVQSLGLMGPFTVRLCAYHAVCLLMTAADHLLLLRLASELWLRLRRARGVGGRSWRRWLVWGRWLLVDGFLASNYVFRIVVMGILTSKQVELWKHLYGPSFRPHPLLSCCLVFPASWAAACAACSAAWRLLGSGGQQPTTAPLLLFQEGFLSGLSSPFYSLAYISFAVLGLGGGGVGGGAGGVLGLAAAGSLLPLWVLDAVAVTPLLAVVVLDVLWSMDTAARATPLMLVIVNALRVHHPHGAVGAGVVGAGAAGGGRRGAGAAGGARGRGLLLGGDAGAAGGVVAHTSLWMLVESARWWARQVRDAAEEQRRQLDAQQPVRQAQDANGVQAGGEPAAVAAGEPPQAAAAAAGPAGGAAPREGAAGAVARVVRAARHAGVAELPPRAIAAMLAALLLPLPEARWPPRQQEHHARALDLLLVAAADPGAPGAGAPGAAARRGGRRRRGPGGGGGAGDWDDAEQEAFDDDDDEGGWQDVDGVDELLGGADRGGGVGGGAAGDEGPDGERLVRTASGNLRPLSALEAELRAGQAQVAALRSQLAAAGRGVSDLLLLGRWPPPLELPPESHAWCEAVPHGFLCPITHALMTQPAMLVSPDLSEASPTYELAAIRQWLRSNRTDPTTGRYLRTYHFLHNDNLRKATEDWVQDRLAREHQAQTHRPHQPIATARRPVHSPGRGRWLAQTPTGAGPSTAASPQQGTGYAFGAAATGWARAGAEGAGVSTAAGGASFGGGPYQPVAGPGPGQRSVCVGTSTEVLRMISPERRRRGVGLGFGGQRGALGDGFCSPPRSKSRGRSQSRGRALHAADTAAGGEGPGGAGIPAAVVVARQVVVRATVRQRVLQRVPDPQ